MKTSTVTSLAIHRQLAQTIGISVGEHSFLGDPTAGREGLQDSYRIDALPEFLLRPAQTQRILGAFRQLRWELDQNSDGHWTAVLVTAGRRRAVAFSTHPIFNVAVRDCALVLYSELRRQEASGPHGVSAP